MSAFQFHIGSIQACKGARYSYRKNTFQFHIGSIQARSESFRIACIHTCFNSTLVRFKRKLAQCLRCQSGRFQFHIGSIQAFFYNSWYLLVTFVSIPHWFDSSRRVRHSVRAMHHGFNSTLVRFKLTAQQDCACGQ